jgi:hypothetical protein
MTQFYIRFCVGLIAMTAWLASLAFAVDEKPASRPATKPVSADIGQGLIKSLDQPYAIHVTQDWKRYLRVPYFTAAGRDRRFRDLGALVERNPRRADLRVLTLEHIGQRGQQMQYERVILYCVIGDGDRKPLADFDAPGLEPRRVASEQWPAPAPHVKELMRIGGSNNGVSSRVYDGTHSGTVICHWDGQRWQIETWFSMDDLQGVYEGGDGAIPETAAGLRAEMRAFYELLYALKHELDPRINFARDFFADTPERYIKQKAK